MGLNELILYLTPFVVWGVTELTKFIFKKAPGWVIISLIVPILSAAATWFGTLIGGDVSWLQQFLLGLLSVFIHELIKQLQQTAAAK